MEILAAIFVIFWSMAGLIAFGMSLVCFGYSGTMAEKALGFLLALFFGPFYWIYYLSSSTYCKA